MLRSLAALLVVALLVHAKDRPSTALPVAKPEAVGLAPAGLAKLDGAMREFVEKRGVAGLVSIVARNGKVAHFKAYGQADAEAGKPMKTDTIFRIYSMSKPITAVAALILVEQGKLALDDPVAKYIPALGAVKVVGKTENDGKPARAITVRDLFCHTSGLSYGFGLTAVDRQYRQRKPLDSEKTLADMVKTLAGIPLQHEPGTRWHYSVSTDVLGYLVEVVSKQSFDVFLSKRIFEPLGMVDTGFHVPKEKLDRFAANYAPGLKLIDAPATSRWARPATLHSGGGGLVSTAADYMRFCLMLARGGEFGGNRILETETVKAMTRNQLPAAQLPIGIGPMKMQGTGFGLGVSVRYARKPADREGQYGWGGAASTGFGIAPKTGLIVITMTQVMPYQAQYHSTAASLALAACKTD